MGGTATAALPQPVASLLDMGAGAQQQGTDGAHTAIAMTATAPQPAAKHGEEGKTHECWYCHKTFGRLFILKRHEKMHTRGVSADPTAPTAGRRKKAKCACTNCQASKQACDDQDTCDFCQKRGLTCERVAKPISTKRKTDDSGQGLVPHPPAERPPKSQSVRRKQHAPTITTHASALLPSPLYNAGWGGASMTPSSGEDMDDWDMSEASTVRHSENSATSDTLTVNDGYLSDDYEDEPAMGVLVEDEALLVSDGLPTLPYAGLTIRTTPDAVALADGFLAAEVADSMSSSPTSASPNGVFIMEEDEEMLDEFEEEEEAERLREQEQLLLIEQETMLRLEEQQRMNEQQHLQLLMMQNSNMLNGPGR